MKCIQTVLALMAVALCTQAQTWEIDYSHSSINFTVTHFFTPVTGKFQKFSGTLEFNPEQVANSKVEFTVPIESINTGNDRRDNDLKSDNFFDAAKFPTMSFVSSRIEKKSGNEYVAFGKLKIRDVSRDVELPFTVLGHGDHPTRKGNLLLAIKSEFKIKRLEYGVGSGNWLSTAVVADEVAVAVFLSARASK